MQPLRDLADPTFKLNVLERDNQRLKQENQRLIDADTARNSAASDLQTRITNLEQANQQLKNRSQQIAETANEEIHRLETAYQELIITNTKLQETNTALGQLRASQINQEEINKSLTVVNKLQSTITDNNQELNDHAQRNQELTNKLAASNKETARLSDSVDDLQETLTKAHTTYQQEIARLQDEIVDLTDCKEHLRRLGQELCGCDHVENADERTEQTRHILETVRKLTDINLDYQQEITKVQNERARLKEDMGEPTILLCPKHNIIHTSTQGCYLCDVENKNLRAVSASWTAKPTV